MRVAQDEIPGLWIEEIQQPEEQSDASIQQQFEAFHGLNPWVLDALEALTADCVNNGFAHVGIGMLFELLRWRYGLHTHGDPFKLNNNFRSRYARLLIERHPEWISVFEVRALRAA
ncbi:hypothetical protein GCM10010193_57050 [Kitasatospora atroaurantiaca]|uniref:Uncharacterized protein n=1 Tax=Kitasatospora atroaurantiaca TaxID=285545 RepID=A0A561EMW6_9ACTN|nr:hypothetical protein [Kitasatospora atroaurantiaca]TWE16954.1 hypothetical protein FB465_1949 [Kitasatospora atroaurantiaca]